MTNAQEARKRTILAVFGLACQIAKNKGARKVVLICRPFEEGIAINCCAEDRSITGLKFFVRPDDNVLLVHKSGEETPVGKLDDDGIQDRIASAILNEAPVHPLLQCAGNIPRLRGTQQRECGTQRVGTARAVRIYKTYGADAIQVMTENPYRLARDIHVSTSHR